MSTQISSSVGLYYMVYTLFTCTSRLYTTKIPSFHSNLACTCNPNPTDHSNHNKMVLEECPIHTLPAANTVKQPTIITYIDVQLLFIHKFATFMYLYSISALKNLILTTFLSHCENDLWLGQNLSGEYVKGEKVPVQHSKAGTAPG